MLSYRSIILHVIGPIRRGFGTPYSLKKTTCICTLMVDQPKPFGVFYQGHTVGDLQLALMCLLNCSSSVVQLIVYKYSLSKGKVH